VTEIDETALVAGKKVPPPPVRPGAGPARIRELQRVAALGWPAHEIATLGGWLLRASAGWTLRANSVLTLAPPGASLDDALGFVTDWYAARALAPAFSIPDLLDAELTPELDARGWPPAARRVLVMVAELSAVRAPAQPGGPPVQLADTPDDGWLSGYRARGGTPPAAVRVLTGNPSAVFASVRVDGTVVGIARSTLDYGWLGISAVETAPEARRQGLAQRLVHALIEHGRGAGARRMFLQAAEDNVPAIALYRGLGLSVHHAYHYRTAPCRT
jgi:ribosomal protein S18 acetylase RimI-like enzyme